MNRLKFTVNMGTERGSREDKRVFACCFPRGLEEDCWGEFDGKEERRSWGSKFTALFVGEVIADNEEVESVRRCMIGGGG